MSLARRILAPLRSRLNRMIADCQQTIERIRDPYRPELHYMRGPGPKWHARHGLVYVIAK